MIEHCQTSQQWWSTVKLLNKDKAPLNSLTMSTVKNIKNYGTLSNTSIKMECCQTPSKLCSTDKHYQTKRWWSAVNALNNDGTLSNSSTMMEHYQTPQKWWSTVTLLSFWLQCQVPGHCSIPHYCNIVTKSIQIFTLFLQIDFKILLQNEPH